MYPEPPICTTCIHLLLPNVCIWYIVVVLDIRTLFTTYIYLRCEWGTWPPMQLFRYIDVDISLNLTASPWGWPIFLSTMDFEDFSFQNLKKWNEDLMFSSMLVPPFMIKSCLRSTLISVLHGFLLEVWVIGEVFSTNFSFMISNELIIGSIFAETWSELWSVPF